MSPQPEVEIEFSVTFCFDNGKTKTIDGVILKDEQNQETKDKTVIEDVLNEVLVGGHILTCRDKSGRTYVIDGSKVAFAELSSSVVVVTPTA